MIGLLREACQILRCPSPIGKVELTLAVAQQWREGTLGLGTVALPPERPARPDLPQVLPPREMPRRKATGNMEKRVALIHALAHIELNAIDLAWDMIARFATPSLPRTFCDDWVKVAKEEAVHFSLLDERLRALGCCYGDLPAHDGLWEAAALTAGDVLARLAIVPLALEARGLDVTPATIEDLRQAGDNQSASILKVIYLDEIGHVAVGQRWFHFFCEREKAEPVRRWHELMARYFRGTPKGPFNGPAREQAGFGVEYWGKYA
ncbi:MAG TPA: ferritin-like domain-containing protein [Dongiaceae bacterium]|jgi:uncharacterized ferritin-like protein (DUF455 family)|nr:ferritin-like domain-containing protein [Dongiaceae bacterium]